MMQYALAFDRPQVLAHVAVMHSVPRDWARMLRAIKNHYGFETDADLAKELGVSQPTVTRWLSGKMIPEADNRERIIRKYRRIPDAEQDPSNARRVPIIGRVLNRGEVRLTEGARPIGSAEMPPNSGNMDLVAVKVEDDSLEPAYDRGAIFYFSRGRHEPAEPCIGKLCVVGLKDGSTLVRRLSRVGGQWALYTVTGVGVPATADIAWCSPVLFVWLGG